MTKTKIFTYKKLNKLFKEKKITEVEYYKRKLERSEQLRNIRVSQLKSWNESIRSRWVTAIQKMRVLEIQLGNKPKPKGRTIIVNRQISTPNSQRDARKELIELINAGLWFMKCYDEGKDSKINITEQEFRGLSIENAKERALKLTMAGIQFIELK